MQSLDRKVADIALRDPKLLRSDAFIDGQWVTDSNRFAIRNPATGDLLAQVPRLGSDATRAAIVAAERALPAWRGMPAHERGRILRRWSELMLQHRQGLAILMTLEQGKPLVE